MLSDSGRACCVSVRVSEWLCFWCLYWLCLFVVRVRSVCVFLFCLFCFVWRSATEGVVTVADGIFICRVVYCYGRRSNSYSQQDGSDSMLDESANGNSASALFHCAFSQSSVAWPANERGGAASVFLFPSFFLLT